MREQFLTSPIAKKLQPPTDFVKLLKANHFDLTHDHGVGSAPGDSRVHYKTLHQNYFKHPPAESRGVSPGLARERQQEMIKAHF